MNLKVGDKLKVTESIGSYIPKGTICKVDNYYGDGFDISFTDEDSTRKTFFLPNWWLTNEAGCFEKLEKNDYSQAIIIYREGDKVYALDKETGDEAVTNLSSDDSFGFIRSASVSFTKLPRFHEALKKSGEEQLERVVSTLQEIDDILDELAKEQML